MLQITQAGSAKPKTSFSIDDIVGRPCTKRQSHSPHSAASISPRREIHEQLSSTTGNTVDFQSKLELLNHRLHGEDQKQGFQPVLPGLHNVPSNLHHANLLRTGLIHSDNVGLLQQNFQNPHASSHTFLNLYNHGTCSPGILLPHNRQMSPGGMPFPAHQNTLPVAQKDFLNLYQLQMHGTSHYFGHRFPDGLLLHPFRKPKRIRTAFSPTQLLQLENAFEKNHYVVGQERKDLAVTLNLTETQVKVWFQNRRTKFKRVKSEESDHIHNADENELGRMDRNIANYDYLEEDEIDVTDSEDEEKL